MSKNRAKQRPQGQRRRKQATGDNRCLATFRRKIGALGRVVKGAQQRKTRRERPAGVLQSLMVRAGGFTG